MSRALKRTIWLGACLAWLVSGPAALAQGAPEPDAEDDFYFEDYEGEEPGGDPTPTVSDPLETPNRGIFAVNDGLDRAVLDPVSTAWDWVLPDFAQRALRNAFDNLRFPVNFFNMMLQGKPRDAGESVARFALNTTIGLAGFMDPAGAIGLSPRSEDFGQTLGVWGVPPGPYLMIPLFGPSNVRDGTGAIVDSGVRVIGFFIPFFASAGMQAVDSLNRRSLIGDQIEAERAAAFDWYAAVRNAYSQHREALVQDRREGVETDGYYPVFEETDETPEP